MADFLDRAEALWQSGSVKDADSSYALVFKAIAELQVVQSKSTLDLDNIESVFALFEMAALFDRLGALLPDEVAGLGSSIRRLIVRTLEETVRMRVGGTNWENARSLPPECYDRFAELVNKTPDASVITFNYDIGLDFGFHWTGRRVDYCLGTPRGNQAIDVMKLHGSVNWGRCPKCQGVLPYHFEEFFKKRNWQSPLEPGGRLILRAASHLSDLEHCGKAIPVDPMIVPPTWSKTQYHREIAPVWQRAAAHLAEAESIICVGYSLPESDYFFRYLYGLGTVGATRLKRFLVYDPDPSGEVADRYQAMLGQAARSRFRAARMTFSDAIGWIQIELGLT